jgi:VWFA-related protein
MEFHELLLAIVLAGVLTTAGESQILSFPTSGNRFGTATAMDAIQSTTMDTSIFRINSENSQTSTIQSASGAVSMLDLKAPGKAQREYTKGFQLLMRRDASGAIPHLANATEIYPKFVAAHNALGTAYLDQQRNQEARDEFARAITLDEHLPNSYLNLGCAELALQDYPAAEKSLQKATELAPMDLPLRVALAYAEFIGKDYGATVDTARELHQKKHEGAALVHYFAAGAWEAQGHYAEAEQEMLLLLREDPKSGSAEQFRKILDQIKTEEAAHREAKLHPAQPVTFSFAERSVPSAEEANRQAQQVLQQVKTKNQIADAEAEPEMVCAECGNTLAVASVPARASSSAISGVTTFHAATDEVAMFFAATDRGKSATDLKVSDIEVQDDSHPPHAILGFRNESELPLRLGLIIDTSKSVTDRLPFEKHAAMKFLQTVMTHPDDRAFVVGVNNSVLLAQDFTGDQSLTSHAIEELAPGGGTALWNAVSFAAEKLAKHGENQPVARVLVIISDGEDNSSAITLKEAILGAQRGETAVYTVSTADGMEEDATALLGQHALRTLSELTGGTAFVPGSIRRLQGSLADLQEVIRGRYLVSYKPASFQRDGRYRAVEIKATKDGHKLKVYARRGYYAAAEQAGDTSR